jgi:hypothetical protein
MFQEGKSGDAKILFHYEFNTSDIFKAYLPARMHHSNLLAAFIMQGIFPPCSKAL